MEKKRKRLLRNQKGFTLIEIIAVLIILGILGAVAIPRYMSVQEDARNMAARGQIAELKGRLTQALSSYMLQPATLGQTPASGVLLVAAANALSANACPTASTTEGDFTFICTGAAAPAKTVTITVSAVQGVALATAQTQTYTFN